MVLWYSPGFYPFSSLSPGTHPGPSPILARIPHFRHSPGFHLFGTCPNFTLSGTCLDSTFPALSWILPFPCTHLDPSPVLSRIPHFRHSPRFYHFPILNRTLLWYSPRFHLSGTRPDSTLSSAYPDSTFPTLA